VRRSLAIGLVLAAAGAARADAGDDGYCDYVEGVASAQAAIQLGPELFSQFGYVEQPPFATNPSQNSGLRFIGGVRVRIDGFYDGVTTKDHARADCRRHKALDQVRGETAARALAARAAVLDGAIAEAAKILRQSDADLEARRTTAQEATATRLRVDELRALSADAHRQLSALPPPTDRPLGAAMTAYHEADAEMEDTEAKLRRAQAFDVSLRFGLDRFLDNTVQNQTPYFAVISVGINLGVLWQGGGNDRAAAGRKKLVASGHDPLGVDATLDRVQATIDIETTRSEQTAALVGELERQLAALDKVGGDDSRRYRQTVWFDWVKAKADAAYLTAHLDSLHQVLGQGATR
jgi:hypothetical protein